MRWRSRQGTRRRGGGSRAELWTWPLAGVVLGIGLASLALRLYPRTEVGSLWPSDTDAASAMLQVIAGAAITVTTLTFSLTVVALQLASQQFSPRLLREFVRDRATKAVLAILVGTFVYELSVLRSLNAERPLPEPALVLGFLLGLVSLASLIGFITHLTRILRVDTMMLTVHEESSSTIAACYADYDDGRPHAPGDIEHGADPGYGTLITARRSGFLRHVRVDKLVRASSRAGAFVRLGVCPGDHITTGTPIASMWSLTPGRDPDPELSNAVHDALNIDYERAMDQDAAFGIQQLEDIAVKTLSPGINDPVTATHAIGHLADLLVKLCGRRLGPTLHTDAEGVGRVIVPDRDLRFYLDLACDQIRRYGAADPTVLKALLSMLRDVAVAARDGEQRAQIDRQIGLIVGEIPASTSDYDAEQVHDMARRVRQVLAGEVRAAFTDRSGETRST